MKKILNDFLAKAAFLQLLFPPHKWEDNEFARFKPGFLFIAVWLQPTVIEINKMALASNLYALHFKCKAIFAQKDQRLWARISLMVKP